MIPRSITSLNRPIVPVNAVGYGEICKDGKHYADDGRSEDRDNPALIDGREPSRGPN
jgi:hypothetical protein